jgi:hypothetical protein
MTRRNRSPRVPEIDEVRARFEQWRQSRKGNSSLPDELWSAAIAVAQRDGVNRTAAALHLDGGKLKRRMVASESHSRKRKSPAFVELVASRTAGLPEYIIELEGSHGMLRVHCKGATTADLAALSRALWSVAVRSSSHRSSASWWQSRPSTAAKGSMP